jgi:hypothetical protein
MKVNVVYDEQGTILVAAVVVEGADEPVALKGERSEVFDVSDDIREDDLGGLVQRFSVDVRAHALRESDSRSQG